MPQNGPKWVKNPSKLAVFGWLGSVPTVSREISDFDPKKPVKIIFPWFVEDPHQISPELAQK